jgi:hypothetical protein
MEKKRFKVSWIIIIAVSAILCLIGIEICLRIIILTDLPASVFSDISKFNKYKDPGIYADPLSEEDYWKLAYYAGVWKPCYGKSHPVLGWSGDFSQDYRHHNIDHLNNRRPVLIFGDSNYDSNYGCLGEIREFVPFFNNDEVFSKDHFFLDYSVNGYGLDQTLLLIQHSIDQYKDPFVIVSIKPTSLDRSILSVTERQKPYFHLEDNVLKPDAMPITSDINAFFSSNPPQITSYLYRRILYSNLSKKYLPQEFTALLKNEDHYKRKKIQINDIIISEIIRELRSRNLDFVFLIYEPFFSKAIATDKENWRNRFIERKIIENNLPSIWSNKLMLNDVEATGRSINDYRDDKCPSDYFVELITKEIKNAVLEKK